LADYRLARRAEGDLKAILATSVDRWGEAASRRYAALMMEAIRRVARNPDAPPTRARPDLGPGIRTFHLRHVPEAAVHKPVHVLVFRMATVDLVEIVRVLHERMDFSRHVTPADDR
jgi:toxin ParE1/3/4